MTRHHKPALLIIIAGACIALAPSAKAYMQRLHSEEVQEAFSLGRSTDPDTVKRFFEKYSHMLDCTGDRPCVNSIELRTPYEQVAVRSRQRGPEYTEQEAEKDYAARPAVLAVHIFVLYPLNFSGQDSDVAPTGGQPTGEDGVAFYGFRIRVSQEHVLKPTRVWGESYSFGASQCRYCGGEEIILDFDPAQFDPEATSIRVSTPNGQTVESEFDLRDLK